MLTSWSITWLIHTITVVAQRGGGLGAVRRETAYRVLDDALGDGGGARRLRLDVALQQIREVGADHQRQREHGNDRGEHERQEQLAVEARPDLAQQRAADPRALPCDAR